MVGKNSDLPKEEGGIVGSGRCYVGYEWFILCWVGFGIVDDCSQALARYDAHE